METLNPATVSRPEDFHRTWAAAFNAGDRTAALALFEPNATMVAQPGQVVQGIEAIGYALDAFLALGAKIQHYPKLIVQSADLALIIADWNLSSTDPAGNPLNLIGQTADVVRKQADGRWLLAIDNPFGSQGAL
ncbi:MAG TPA: SgcJ/EcaC family oxidoreductase [Chloroflexia bacterium]|nr:SgcJ/EcaC family oxidoreductase [Chloroflexia bacterium]